MPWVPKNRQSLSPSLISSVSFLVAWEPDGAEAPCKLPLLVSQHNLLWSLLVELDGAAGKWPALVSHNNFLLSPILELENRIVLPGSRANGQSLSPVTRAGVHDYMPSRWDGETPSVPMAYTLQLFGIEAGVKSKYASAQRRSPEKLAIERSGLGFVVCRCSAHTATQSVCCGVCKR